MLHFTHYIADTSSIINLQEAKYLGLVTHLVRAGLLKITGRVAGELTGPRPEDKDPELARWVNKHKNVMEIPDDEIPDEVLADIIRRYPSLTRGRRGLLAADPQFVAALKCLSEANPALVGLSDDGEVRRACQKEDLACIGWKEFVAREVGRAP